MTQIVLAIVATAMLAATATAQAMQFSDVKDRKGLEVGYNRFKDISLLRTKRDPVIGKAGKGTLLDPRANQRMLEIFAGVTFPGQAPAQPIDQVLLAICPETRTAIGRMFTDLEREKGKGSFYIQPGAEVIAIADGERINLGEVLKPGQLDQFGDYTGTAFLAIPLDQYRKLVTAKKLEMAVGSIEIEFNKRNVERLAALLAEIDARQVK